MNDETCAIVCEYNILDALHVIDWEFVDGTVVDHRFIFLNKLWLFKWETPHRTSVEMRISAT